MSIYLNGAKGNLFEGKYRPVILSKDADKKLGYNWNYEIYEGTSLNIPSTYHYKASITIKGNTTEMGTGVKDYKNPFSFVSSANFDLISTNDREHTCIHFPYTLRSMTSGAADYIKINHREKTATLFTHIDTVALDWNKNWTRHTGGDLWAGNMVAFNNVDEYNYIFSKSPHMQCTHFELIQDPARYYYYENVGFLGSSWIGFKFFASDLGITSSTTTKAAVSLFKSWLEQQSLAGNPVTLMYQRSIPTETALPYHEFKQYYPYTKIATQNTEVPPMLSTQLYTMP